MTDFANLLLPDRGEAAQTLTPLLADNYEGWLKDRPSEVRTLAAAAQFKAKPGELLILPGKKDGDGDGDAGHGDADSERGAA